MTGLKQVASQTNAMPEHRNSPGRGTTPPDLRMIPCAPTYTSQVIDLTIKTWAPVFEKTKTEVRRFLFDTFYPDGWEKRHAADVTDLLDIEPANIWIALQQGDLARYIGLCLHPEDRMGAI
ncbi:MAG: hypothetical protein AAGA05_14955 [Pseudomonadota bacterium]